MDAPYVVEKAGEAYKKWNALDNLQHRRFSGGHAMTKERYDCIVGWFVANMKERLDEQLG